MQIVFRAWIVSSLFLASFGAVFGQEAAGLFQEQGQRDRFFPPIKPGPLAPLQTGDSPSGFETEWPRAYFGAVNVGPYFFTGDLDDMDTGIYAEGLVGFFLGQYFSLEVGAGWLDADGSTRDFRADVTAVPIFMTGKVTFRLREILDVYAGVGGGVYITDLDVRSSTGDIDDDANIWGGHALVGMHVNIGLNQFIGIEGKYINTEAGAFEGERFDLDGWAVMVSLSAKF